LNGCGGSGGGGGDSGGGNGGTTPTIITWDKRYGENYDDAAYSIQQTADGGYIVAGTITADSNYEILVIKIDYLGNIVWQYKQQGIANSIINSGDGGFIIAGQIGIPVGKIGLIKLNSSGAFQWQNTYGSFGDIANEVKPTSDGGYIIVGESSGDVYVVKADADGNLEWARNYGGTETDRGYAIQLTNDNGYIVAGETYSFGSGNADFWIFKIDGNGNLISGWPKLYGGSGYDTARAIQQTADGGYIVAGETSSFGAGNSDIWLLRLNSNGEVIWQKTYGGTGNEVAYFIQQTSDGGYIVSGETSSFGAGGSDVWIIKLDNSGNIIWQKVYGGSGDDVARSIQQTADGGYIVAGLTTTDAGDTDFWVLKLDANGNLN